jgi:hypothetical protein
MGLGSLGEVDVPWSAVVSGGESAVEVNMERSLQHSAAICGDRSRISFLA